jgi:uncharacterized membrane protein
MASIHAIAIFAALLGSALIAGTFFGFSAFIMTALGRIAPAAGITAMQSINIVVINPLFLSVFVGTAAIGVCLAIAALFLLPRPEAVYSLIGSLSYCLGAFLLTMRLNVPLNNDLARVQSDSDEGKLVWNRYLIDWVRWNHVRTAASLAATALFALALT